MQKILISKIVKIIIEKNPRFVFDSRNIKKGDILKENNIWVKRPGTGEIKAEFYNDVLDKISLRDIKKGEHLNWKDFE